MTSVITVAKVYLWGRLMGYVSWNESSQMASFEYDHFFLEAPVEPSPLMMPKGPGVFTFRELNHDTYKGLPGLLADCLPDRFGSAMIDAWLVHSGRKNALNPIEKLCYIGTRGMGALEFKPALYRGKMKDVAVEINDMVKLASNILENRKQWKKKIQGHDKQKNHELLTQLLTIGTSAGGARAKGIIALNEKTGEVRSGQVKTTEDFTYWLLKLDGIATNKDRELDDPLGFGRIEYAYYLMARDCGIDMMESKLLEENNRAHFMTRRFDRTVIGNKLHMQSLCGLAHFDFNMPGAYSYEQALDVINTVVQTDVQLDNEQMFRRAVFNVLGRNQDDHTKNIAFLMNQQGQWRLSPAFDLTYAYNPKGLWTNTHQMQLNNKREGFEMNDLIALAEKAFLKKTQAKKIIHAMQAVFKRWNEYAKKSGIDSQIRNHIQKNLMINL